MIASQQRCGTLPGRNWIATGSCLMLPGSSCNALGRRIRILVRICCTPPLRGDRTGESKLDVTSLCSARTLHSQPKGTQHMKSAVETLEERIRQCAYHIWEANGRPSGRDEEFWTQACEMITANDGRTSSRVPQRQRKQAQPARLPRKRSRLTTQPGMPAPAG
jgi:Protein of unknown function (DUF2934)